jgi:murein DD-endopeptidase MepM/ murein hydrolase activator NlpD
MGSIVSPARSIAVSIAVSIACSFPVSIACSLPVAPAVEAVRVRYRPPVVAPVADPWRPPATPYGAGNRGVEYATEPGTEVVAPADGTVSFAGPVAGRGYVVIGHADGIRTTLGGLERIDTVAGARVVAGQVVGLAAGPLHFGARRGSAYLDPTTLLGTGPARLVPRSG